MIRTLVQLQWMTLRGRVVRSLRLLKQPKYLVGAVVGAAWMLFWIGRPMMDSGLSWRAISITGIESMAASLLVAAHQLAAIFFVVILSLPWLYPFGKLGLGFREADLPGTLTHRSRGI